MLLLVLAGLLAISSACLCVLYINRTKQLRAEQSMVAVLTQRQQLFGMLWNESVEFAKTNSAMEQLLRSVTTTQPQRGSAAPPAATKPGSK